MSTNLNVKAYNDILGNRVLLILQQQFGQDFFYSLFYFNTSGVTVNADLEPKTHHQTPITCTYGYSHFRHFQICCNRDGNKNFKYMNYVPIVVATDLEVHFLF